MKHFYYGHLYERVTDYYSRFPKWPYFKDNENVKCNQTPCSSDSTNERILHHVLNTLLRLLHSDTIISNIFCHTQVLYEKAVLKSFKNSQENTYAGVFLNRVACLLPASLLQIYLFLYRRFAMNFAKYFRFSVEHRPSVDCFC